MLETRWTGALARNSSGHIGEGEEQEEISGVYTTQLITMFNIEDKKA